MNERTAGGIHGALVPRAAARLLAGLALGMLAGALLCACSSAPARPEPPAAQPAAQFARPAAPAAPGMQGAAPTPAGQGGASAAAHPQVTPAAQADFNRAVNFVRAGNATEAELGFKQMALQYPQYAAPLVNLGILQRKQGHLDQAEESLKSAVARESGSALAWTELGATQRMRGEFKDAAFSYERAIAADGHYAPAWRNLGVLSDLYLGDPDRALSAFEQYKQLTGEDKPVSGWIAELRQRLGMPPLKRPEATTPAEGNPGGAPGAAPGGTSAPGATPAPGSVPSGAPAPALQPAASPANAVNASPAPRAGG